MKKPTRLYNVLLPLWLLALFPQVWLIIIPGNLIIDCAVLLLTLLALKHTEKKAVFKRLWWKFWLLGFAADFVGTAWMFLGWLSAALEGPVGDVLESSLLYILRNPFLHPAAFFWALAGLVIAGVCIYFFDKRAMRSCQELTGRERHILALTMAIVTAPWTFLIPTY